MAFGVGTAGLEDLTSRTAWSVSGEGRQWASISEEGLLTASRNIPSVVDVDVYASLNGGGFSKHKTITRKPEGLTICGDVNDYPPIPQIQACLGLQTIEVSHSNQNSSNAPTKASDMQVDTFASPPTRYVMDYLNYHEQSTSDNSCYTYS